MRIGGAELLTHMTFLMPSMKHLSAED